jgi:hypothetical protein
MSLLKITKAKLSLDFSPFFIIALARERKTFKLIFIQRHTRFSCSILIILDIMWALRCPRRRSVRKNVNYPINCSNSCGNWNYALGTCAHEVILSNKIRKVAIKNSRALPWTQLNIAASPYCCRIKKICKSFKIQSREFRSQ